VHDTVVYLWSVLRVWQVPAVTDRSSENQLRQHGRRQRGMTSLVCLWRTRLFNSFADLFSADWLTCLQIFDFGLRETQTKWFSNIQQQ